MTEMSATTLGFILIAASLLILLRGFPELPRR
jgi:hypothetical protein